MKKGPEDLEDTTIITQAKADKMHYDKLKIKSCDAGSWMQSDHERVIKICVGHEREGDGNAGSESRRNGEG